MYSCARSVSILVLCAAGALADKAYKPGEYDLYNEVTKDLLANNFTKGVTDLELWKSKIPDTDYSAERAVLFMKAYMGAKQWPQALDLTAELLPQLDTLFADPKDGPGQALQVLFNAASATPLVADPRPAQAAAGEQAARLLMKFDRRPPGVTDENWTKLRSDVQPPAKAALLFLALLPGNRAMTTQPRDCAAAQVAYVKALEDFPDSAAASYNLGTALSCLRKNAEAVYEFERAAVIEPARFKDTADRAYLKFHGSDEGLDALKAQVMQSPVPPVGFTMRSASQIAADKEAQFEQSNPQLALWLKIKAALADAGGEQYFESQLKNSAVPQLKGTLVEARPACRSRELRVAVTAPGQPAVAEIAIKLDRPLTGKPELGTELRWEGVPTAFTQSPFLLTMDAEAQKVQGLKKTPCVK